MDYKKANRAYLYSIVLTIAFVVLFGMWQSLGGKNLSVILSNFISEMMVLLPTLAVVLFHGEKLSVVIPLKKIRIPSVLLTFLYVFTLYPLITLANAVSMLFTDNVVTELSGDIVKYPMWMMLFSIGIFGPFVEEIVFRGVILQSFQRTGRIIGSMILSSFMFGLMHMNLNQLIYGAVMGLTLALLVEATGSVLTSFIAHGVFNSIEVLLMYGLKDYMGSAEEILEGISFKQQLLITIGVDCVLAVIFTALALCIVYKMADLEGRKEFMRMIPRSKKQGYKLITIPLILAILLGIGYMAGIEYLLHVLYG